MEGVTALVMIGLTVAVFVVWHAQSRDPDRWQRWFSQAVWSKALVWTAAVTAAAVVGSLVAGGTEVATAAIALGFLVLYALFRVWSLAKTFRRPNDHDSHG
jgi:uncharacterized membrane protein YfcA